MSRMIYIGDAALTLIFRASATSTADTITIPATAQVGDIAYLADFAWNNLNTPTSVIPTNWTQLGTSSSIDIGATAARGNRSYRILQAGEPGASITGMNGDVDTKVMVVFSGGIVTATPAAAAQEITGGDPAAQSITASAGTAPLIVLGATASDTSTTPDFSTESPAFDDKVLVSAGGAVGLRVGYKIYNSAPADHSIDMNDLGTINWLCSDYIQVI